MNNPLRRTVYIWMVITVVAFIMIFVPDFIGMDGFSGGFAISFASLFGVIIGLIVVGVYNGLASRLDKILNGEGVLATWTYDPETWRQYTEIEFASEKAEAKPKFYLVAVIALIVGLAFYLIDPEGGLFVLGAMIALIAVIGFVAWASTRYMYTQNVHHQGDTIIAKDGVFLNGRYYYWNYFGTRLTKVEIKEEKGLKLLHLVTWSPSLTFGQSWDIRVPIPAREDSTSENIVKQLSSS